MSHRKVIVGPFHAGYLARVSTDLNPKGASKELPVIDVNGAFYACMIQAGIEQFVALGPLVYTHSDFLERRTVPLPDEDWLSAVRMVKDSLAKFLPEDYDEDDKYFPVSVLSYFISDLMLAVKKKSSVLVIGTPRDVSELADLVPPELYIALKNLMSSIESENAKLPLPKDLVSADNVLRFQEVISSDLFSKYSAKHNQFEDGRVLKIDAAQNVEASGRSLIGRNRGLLKAQRMAVAMIPLSTKIVDTVFGKLPGALAEFFGQQLSGWVKDDRRIVIYNSKPIIQTLYDSHRVSLAKFLGENQKGDK